VIEFGRFKVVRHRRELLADGRPLELGSRAFDTLIALIDARGTVLSKEDLMSRVWPDRVVEENNLAAQIFALRKLFGADRQLIRTVAGRGYQFTGDIRVTAAPAGGPAPPLMTNLPEAVSELIGREAELAAVTALATEHRLVSLVGAGGIGKTRLGLEVARHLVPRFPDGVLVAELGPLSSPELVPAAMASALGLTHVAHTLTNEGVAGAVGTKTLLLVMDNCEHVIDAAARMAEALLRASPGVSLVATSREPLRVSGEYVFRVPPLDVPAEDNKDMEGVFKYGAVRLFVSRARAAEPRYVAEGRVAAATVAICRRLDGIPLAIELAATRVAAFGVDGVAARLDDRFRLLTGGRRTALPRHQTMRATLDWSYELLSASDRLVLRRLGVFVGAFTLDAASAVAASADLPASEVAESIATLVSKSLVSTDVGDTIVRYRLLETTRAYARGKLIESAELDDVARCHAKYFRDLFARAEAELETRPTAEWLAAYRPHIDDLRTALDWAFSPSGDLAVGVALTAATVPLWTHLSLLTECRERVEQAITSLAQVPSDPRRDMRLYLALGQVLSHFHASARPEVNAALTKALNLAEITGDGGYRLAALHGLYLARLYTGEYRSALDLAETFRTGAAETADRSDVPIGNLLIGLTRHVLGDQPGARRQLEPLVRSRFVTARPSHISLYQYDHRVVLECYYARVMWLQGFGDKARGLTQKVVDYVRTIDHLRSFLYTLTIGTCPIALFVGDLETVENHVRLAFNLAARHALEIWSVWAQCFEGILLIRRGNNLAARSCSSRRSRDCRSPPFIIT
jgi:predicted ATPase